MHMAFFGDAEHAFSLSGSLIPELERKTGAGIGQLSRRIMSGEFRYAEILEVVRLGLIGGGMSPQSAAELITAYADKTPISELYPLALRIIEQRFFGTITTDSEEAGDE